MGLNLSTIWYVIWCFLFVCRDVDAAVAESVVFIWGGFGDVVFDGGLCCQEAEGPEKCPDADGVLTNKILCNVGIMLTMSQGAWFE